MERNITFENMSKKIEELEKENKKLREELEYYRNRKVSGRQRHNAKWMAIYNDFVAGYESGNVYVQMGIMKTKVSVMQLKLIEEQKVTYKSKPVSTRNIKSKMERRGTMELDIRGKSADEGVYEMEAFIDNAVLSGLNMVTIIHGVPFYF